MNKYEPHNFWNSRYEKFDITTSGHIDLPFEYNEWLYKMKKKKIREAAEKRIQDFEKKNIMELGCGTGVYVQMWQDLGAKSLVGLDIAPLAIDQLKINHPHFSFFAEDLSDHTVSARHGKGKFDLVTAIGVLVHIVDDNQFKTAIENISQLAADDGVVIISDYIVRGGEQEYTYMKHRSLPAYREMLREAGLEIVEQVPFYYLMIYPFDTPSSLEKFFLPRIYGLMTRLIRRSPKIAGRVFFYVDSFITRFITDGPSEELFVCRKIKGM